MPSIQQNTYWNTAYEWSEHGDEWNDQAAFCGVPYPEWKESIVDTFIAPFIHKDCTALEIAPGHGRWSEYFIRTCKNVYLVDMNEACIDFCKQRFSNYNNIEYVHNDGMKLGGVADKSIDFVFSYDSFVHMEQDVIGSYLQEISRVLQAGGSCILHHSGRFDIAIKLGLHRLKKLGTIGYLLYQLCSIGRVTKEGWRANVSKKIVQYLAEQAGLQIEYQIQEWGQHNKYNVHLFHDYITKLVKKKN